MRRVSRSAITKASMVSECEHAESWTLFVFLLGQPGMSRHALPGSAPPALPAGTSARGNAAGQHRLAALPELRCEQLHEHPVVAAAHGHARATAAAELPEAGLGVD